MRLFVALSISSEVRENLASVLKEFQSADPRPRWITPANLHVTLKFIGHITADRQLEIESALARMRAPYRFAVHFRGIGFFPNDRRPTVIWAGIAAPPDLTLLADQIDATLSQCAVPSNARPFQPHLTLARLKEEMPINPALRALTHQYKDHSFGTLSVNQFALIESRLKSSGAEYTTLRSFPLAAEGTIP